MRITKYAAQCTNIMPAIRLGSTTTQVGVEVDVQDSGFWTSIPEAFRWLDEWCKYRYLIHTGGHSYSAGLKYKLACGEARQ